MSNKVDKVIINSTLQPGSYIADGRFYLHRKIGAGSHGDVFLSKDTTTDEVSFHSVYCVPYLYTRLDYNIFFLCFPALLLLFLHHILFLFLYTSLSCTMTNTTTKSKLSSENKQHHQLYYMK